MIARLILSISLLIGTHAMATNDQALDDLMTPDELAAEVGITEPTDVSPRPDPLSPEQVFDAYRVSVFSEFPVVIVVSKGSQTATVYYYGNPIRRFPVSTGRERWERAKSGKVYFTSTPSGWFSPKRYIRDHWSTTWEADMEYSIFFTGGIALHATTPSHYKELGRKASGGCIRMHKRDAAWFWNLSVRHRRAYVPYFTRGGQLLRNRDGSIKRHTGNGTLIVVTSH